MRYIRTLPDSFLARREIFTPFKYTALVGFVFFGSLSQIIDYSGAIHVFGVPAAMCIVTFLAITFLSPSIVAAAAEVIKILDTKKYKFSAVYLAHTGYYDDSVPPRAILGLYAANFIKKG